MSEGKIYRVSGPVVIALGLDNPSMYDVVKVGKLGLIGEIIKLDGDQAVIQVYEDTTGIRPGESVVNTHLQLSVDLGPGLLGSIYDGIQRPLDKIKEQSGDFIERGASAPSLDQTKAWHFVPTAKNGSEVSSGSVIGEVAETELVLHKIMVPAGLEGKIMGLSEGDYTINQKIGEVVKGELKTAITLSQRWNVRSHRPVREKIAPHKPLITGQRVIDSLFPVAKGGTAAVPGPFGSGKTVIQQQLAKWSDADVIVYVGCGERGNEMADILMSFPKLLDPKSGKPIMDRTILIANTSNMPVAAREASIYTGITIAEYYRDMGYSVALMSDSTSRWAEALREISGRLEEMPGEEGYPAYLGRRIAEFYERAGMSILLNGETGSITVIGAVSPPGGDVSEPVSQNTLRATRVFWALDSALANARHFPAINWLNSYSLYTDDLKDWYSKNVAEDWESLYKRCMSILQKEAEIKDVVQLVGYDALPEDDKITLYTAQSIREDFLQQSAFDEVDTYTTIKKQGLMLRTIISLDDAYRFALSHGTSAEELRKSPIKQRISRMKFVKEDEIEGFCSETAAEIAAIGKKRT
jgi:V/A-type H+-transporting ATPase subunit A